VWPHQVNDQVNEILTFNKWSLKVYRFQERAFLQFTFLGVDFDVSVDAIIVLAKQKQNGFQ